jgi:hypothetical protein
VAETILKAKSMAGKKEQGFEAKGFASFKKVQCTER